MFYIFTKLFYLLLPPLKYSAAPDLFKLVLPLFAHRGKGKLNASSIY